MAVNRVVRALTWAAVARVCTFDIPSLFTFRSDRVGSSLDEGLDLCDIFIFQLTCKVRHAPITERSLEHDILEIGDLFSRDVAKIPHIFPFVDAGDAVAGNARRDVQRGALRNVLGVVLDSVEQVFGLILHEPWQLRLVVKRKSVDRAWILPFGGALRMRARPSPRFL
jgi:hypothetical protein